MLSLLRSTVLGAALAAGAAETGHRALTLPPLHRATFGTLLTELAAWTVVACCLWALALLVAATTEGLTRGRVAATRWVPCPEVLRRWTLGLVGAAVVCAAASPAHADQVGSFPGAGGTLVARRADVAGLPVPARPAGMLRALPVVVRDGDSLWSLVAARMPASAPDQEVALAVTDAYRSNRRLIGPDPDLIQPGQHLVLSPRAETDRHHRAQEDR